MFTAPASDWLGILDAPRRTMLGAAPYYVPEWTVPAWLTAAGGLVLFASGLLYVLNVGLTVWRSREPSRIQVPEAVPLHDEHGMPLILDRLRPWVLGTVALSAAAWLPMLWRMAVMHPWNIRGFTMW